MARILVVEDDQDILDLIQFRLRKAGHRVAATSRPDDALRMASSAPDLAILDVGLPGMTGLELLTELRSRPGVGEVPAIFVSARVQDEDIAAGRALGATYLTKPFVAAALMNAVDGILADLAAKENPVDPADPYR